MWQFLEQRWNDLPKGLLFSFLKLTICRKLYYICLWYGHKCTHIWMNWKDFTTRPSLHFDRVDRYQVLYVLADWMSTTYDLQQVNLTFFALFFFKVFFILSLYLYLLFYFESPQFRNWWYRLEVCIMNIWILSRSTLYEINVFQILYCSRIKKVFAYNLIVPLLTICQNLRNLISKNSIVSFSWRHSSIK